MMSEGDLADIATVEVDEEICHWQECSNVALYLAVMSKGCPHRWTFCIPHRDAMDHAQTVALAADKMGEWQCLLGGEQHNVGILIDWESARG